MKIRKPTLIIDVEKTTRNINRMKEKVSASGIRFRPHFKTHQSSLTGEWFRKAGVTAITVSSVDMALYFARHGWTDITIGVLVNPLEIDALNELARGRPPQFKKVALGLLVDTAEMVTFLQKNLEHRAKAWIKIDTGYHRTGIEWDREDEIFGVAKAINDSPTLFFGGLLSHSGQSYNAASTAEIRDIYEETVTRMNGIRDFLKKKGIEGLDISIGDTPTCSVVEKFHGIDEVRNGNFVYYDLMQLALGTCTEEDIAAAVACPVIGVYPRRNEIVVYGGAVHLSKEFITDNQGRKIFGMAALPGKTFDKWGGFLDDTYVSSLSQEHGVIKTTGAVIRRVKVGDILMILPVHSCLAVNLLKEIKK
ncbi:alanine racemase [Acidobacteriota bacterium]